ncbi:hypothetical protein MRX96_012508 [Rhipicephalus microplus]
MRANAAKKQKVGRRNKHRPGIRSRQWHRERREKASVASERIGRGHRPAGQAVSAGPEQKPVRKVTMGSDPFWKRRVLLRLRPLTGLQCLARLPAAGCGTAKANKLPPSQARRRERRVRKKKVTAGHCFFFFVLSFLL